jgi:hypothetical protein
MSQVPRWRTNDPLGVSDNPVCVTDPVRVAEIAREFQRRLAYIERSYEVCKAEVDDVRSFNDSVSRLKRAVAEPSKGTARKSRLHPRLEILISCAARQLARIEPDVPLGVEHVAVVDQAAREVAAKVSAIRGRPSADRVRHHVEGLMALIQETCGMPVLATRDVDEVPRVAAGVSRIIPLMFSRMDPAVTETQLFNIIRKARRTYAGKPMRFRDFFPLYGARVNRATLAPVPQRPYKLLHFEVAAPIYCP